MLLLGLHKCCFRSFLRIIVLSVGLGNIFISLNTSLCIIAIWTPFDFFQLLIVQFSFEVLRFLSFWRVLVLFWIVLVCFVTVRISIAIYLPNFPFLWNEIVAPEIILFPIFWYSLRVLALTHLVFAHHCYPLILLLLVYLIVVNGLYRARLFYYLIWDFPFLKGFCNLDIIDLD